MDLLASWQLPLPAARGETVQHPYEGERLESVRDVLVFAKIHLASGCCDRVEQSFEVGGTRPSQASIFRRVSEAVSCRVP